MLKLGPVFRRAYGEYVAARSLRRSSRARPIWGDEWVEDSLGTLWYPCSWRDVSHDELVLLIPTLATPETGQFEKDGPSRYLHRALAAHLRRSVILLSGSRPGRHRAVEEVMDTIVKTGAVTTVDIRECWASGAADIAEFYGDPPALAAYPIDEELERWVFELTVLACLDRVLADSKSPDVAADTRHDCDPFNLPAILLATIYSSFNAAYIYPQLRSLHELFSAGAWLGHLLRGRAALMPEFIADSMIESLRPSKTDDSIWDRCDRLLRTHADMAIGADKLLQIAARAKKQRAPVLVRPARIAEGHLAALNACVKPASENIVRHLRAQLLQN